MTSELHNGPRLRGPQPRPRTEPRHVLRRLPPWAVVLTALLALALTQVVLDPSSRDTLEVVRRGIVTTVRVTLLSFALALTLGVIAGLARAGRGVGREIATFYIEVVRGVPLLVLILWFGFAFAPWFARQLGEWGLVSGCERPSDCLPMEARGVIGLAVGYGAYIAEVVRAGIQSVDRGQREAASSLGMSSRQAMRHVILPQAMRLALPPLGNDFVALLKDSSLVSVLAVSELTHEARVYVARTFNAMEVWNLVALTYLLLTLAASAGVRWVERRATWVEE